MIVPFKDSQPADGPCGFFRMSRKQMMARRVSILVSPLLLVGGCVMLSGCSGTDAARAFGLERSMPDEYTVTTRAPLSMPTSDELDKPTHNGDERRQDESERLQALETPSPDVALRGTNGDTSEGQTILVNEAAAASDTVDTGELTSSGSSFVEQLMFWRGRSGTVVDAKAENRRLKTNAALGKSPTKGATPTTNARQ